MLFKFDSVNLDFSDYIGEEQIESLRSYFEILERKVLYPEHYEHNDIYDQWRPSPKTVKIREDGYEFVGRVRVTGQILLRNRIEKGILSANSDRILQGFFDRHKRSLEELNSYNFEDFYSRIVQDFGLDFSEVNYPCLSEKKGLKYKDSISYNDVRNAIIFRTTLFFKPYKKSKLLWVKIDPKNMFNERHFLMEYEMMHVVSEHLGVEPVFVSSPPSSSGSHYMLFKLSEYVSDKKREELEEFFYKEFGFKIKIFKKDDKEYRTYKDYIPLPFSRRNIFYGIYEPTAPVKVNPTGILELLDHIESSEEGSCSGIKRIVGNINEGEVIKGKRVQASGHEFLQNLEQRACVKYSYGAGTRYENQRKLAFWCIYHKMDFFDYAIIARGCNDGSSKDMKAWSDAKIDKELRSYFDFASRVVSFNVDDFKRDLSSSEEGIIYDRRDLKTVLDLDGVARQKFIGVLKIWYDHLYPSKKSKGLWREYFLRDAEELMKFLLRKKAYDDETKKTYVDPAMKVLEQGTTIPQKIWSALSEHLGLRTSIKKILSVFEQAGLIKRLSVGGYEFSYKRNFYSIHFLLTITTKQLIYLYKKAKSLLYMGLSSLLNYIEEVAVPEMSAPSVRSSIPRRNLIFEDGFS